MPEYLLGRAAMPAQSPAYVGWGDESEAVSYVEHAAAAWAAAPGAMAWLDAAAPARSAAETSRGRRRAGA